MNRIIENVRDGFWRLYDWCMGNKRVALAAAASILLAVMTMSVMFCGSRKLDSGTDEVHGTTWSYHADGTLKFSGSGELVGQKATYTEAGTTVEQPLWYDYRAEVIAIEIGEEITAVGMDSFVEFNALRTITVFGESTELDIECIRYETAEGWENYPSITVCGKEGSSAQSYAEFSGLNYSPLTD